MDVNWDGITRAESLSDEAVQRRGALADAAKRYDWAVVLDLLAREPDWVNSTRLGGTSLYAPLHQAAHGGAPADVIRRLIDLGALRTLRNARGERPVDIAARKRRQHLINALAPEIKHRMPLDALLKIQAHFHAVIQNSVGDLVKEHALRLPELEPLLELDPPEMWFPVPGMYGGFSYRLETAGADARLISESWSRVVWGSGRRHEISPAGSRLVAEGFV
ncbi:MAG: ankyrin repeat domain-containing protein [Thermoflexales bacterium]